MRGVGCGRQTCMQSDQYVFERRGPWTRWVWINFHLAVWISIAYAIGVAIEQHLDWLDDDATFGRRREGKEAFIPLIFVLGQVVGWF